MTLIIDDDPVIISVLTDILSQTNIVKVTGSGEVGLIFAEKYEIDMILLGVVIQGMSGFEVLAALKANEKTKDIPVIITAGAEGSDDETKALVLGAVDHNLQIDKALYKAKRVVG